jgi:hypothetical protein
MLGAMARIAPAGGSALSIEAQTTMWASNRLANFKFSLARLFQKAGTTTRAQNFTFSVAAVSDGSPLYCSVF